MKKKIPLIIIFTIIIGWFVYRALHAPVTRDEIVIDSDTSIAPDKNSPTSLKVNPHAPKKVDSIEQNVKVHETADANFEVFDQMEKIWLKKSEEIMGAKNYLLYLEMRDRSEKEKLMAYKEYHNYLKHKYGDNFTYNISEDQSIREKQINERYLKELLRLIGPASFKKYTEARDIFNENMRRDHKESIQIEF